MRKKKIDPVFVIFLLITLIACKKSNEERSTDIVKKFNPLGLPYVQLPQGKYRVYKDSATGHVDSTIITTSSIEQKFSPRDASWFIVFPAFYYDVFQLVLTKADGSEWFNGRASADTYFSFTSTDTALIDVRETDNTPAFFYPLTPGESLLISLNVEGKSYDNVIRVVNDNGLPLSDPNAKFTIYYWAKSVGIIKRTLKTSTGIKTWNLLRYN